MDRIEEAVALFTERGHNCAQSVFVPFAVALGLDRDTAVRLSAPLGGGMGRQGDTCGAVAGALMAIGLRFGESETTPDSKARIYAMAGAFLDDFRAAHGALACRDLLGYDYGTAEGAAEIHDRGLTRTICPGLVRNAAEILERMLFA